MSNAFSAVIATATDAAQIVSREPTGFIDAIDFRPDIVGATLNSTVNIGVVTPPTKAAWSPSIVTSVADSTEVNVPLTLTQAFEYKFHITGEQLKALSVGNFTGEKYVKTKLAQAFRSCRNDIEAYLALKAKVGANRALGTAGTTPFASNMDLTATIKRNLEQNGAPGSDLSLILDPFAAENVRKLLGSVTAAGGSLAADMQRSGLLPSHNQLQIRTSPQIALHTKGNGTGYTATAAAAATDITLASGSNNILAGDILAMAGDTNNYVAAKAASTNALIAGLINRPGLLASKAAAAITIGSNYTPNIALHRGALVAVVRPPAQVDPGSFQGVPLPFLADVVVDPETGLPYGIYMQAGDGLILISVRAIYDAAPVNTEHIITLMG